MASIIPHKSGGYRAMVFVEGQRATKVLATEREAKNWAAAKETELRKDKKRTPAEKFTLADAIDRYMKEVSPTKRSHLSEVERLNAILRQPHFPSDIKLRELDTSDFIDWKKARQKIVKPNTIIIEVEKVSAVLNRAKKEWKWIEDNPLSNLSRPERPLHRTTLITWTQIKSILHTLNYSPRGKITERSQIAAMMFLISLRTGMRRVELVRMKWTDVKQDHVHLPLTKTNPRDVPLEVKTKRLFEKMRGVNEEMVFGLSSCIFAHTFWNAKDKAGLAKDFTFHDSRHTAATWMAKHMDVLTLCKMFGWQNPQQAMTYYNPTAADVAKMLNAKRSGNRSQ